MSLENGKTEYIHINELNKILNSITKIWKILYTIYILFILSVSMNILFIIYNNFELSMITTVITSIGIVPVLIYCMRGLEMIVQEYKEY